MELFRREQYLSKIRGFYHDTDIIKVITGVRRCGKSSLMEMIRDELIGEGVSEERIIYLDLDSRKYIKIKTDDCNLYGQYDYFLFLSPYSLAPTV